MHGAVTPHRTSVLVTMYRVSSTGTLTQLGTARTLSTAAWTLAHTFPTTGTRTLLARTTADTLNTSGSRRTTVVIT